MIIVDAGIATQDRFAAATDQDALLGRLRRQLYVTVLPYPYAVASEVIRRGTAQCCIQARSAPEVEPTEEFLIPGDKGDIRALALE